MFCETQRFRTTKLTEYRSFKLKGAGLDLASKSVHFSDKVERPTCQILEQTDISQSTFVKPENSQKGAGKIRSFQTKKCTAQGETEQQALELNLPGCNQELETPILNMKNLVDAELFQQKSNLLSFAKSMYCSNESDRNFGISKNHEPPLPFDPLEYVTSQNKTSDAKDELGSNGPNDYIVCSIHNACFYVNGTIGQTKGKLLIDTGSSICVLSEKVFERLNNENVPLFPTKNVSEQLTEIS